MLPSVVPQPRHRGVDVLAIGGERLTHDLDVPSVAILAARRFEVAYPAGDLGGRGRVGHKADLDYRHRRDLPTPAPTETPDPGTSP